MIAAIASIGEAEELPRLVDNLLADGHRVIVLCNTEEPGPYLEFDSRATCDIVPDLSLYGVWNMALRAARLAGQWLAILNDDIVLGPGALSTAENLMVDDPEVAVCGLAYSAHRWLGLPALRYVHGSYRRGGVNGCAFIVRPDMVPDVDERFEWWYGDDDLFLSAEAAGHKLAIADGCWVVHRGEATAISHAWTEEAKLRDHKRFTRKWGDEA